MVGSALRRECGLAVSALEGYKLVASSAWRLELVISAFRGPQSGLVNVQDEIRVWIQHNGRSVELTVEQGIGRSSAKLEPLTRSKFTPRIGG